MHNTADLPPPPWRTRYEQARDALLDRQHVLDVRAQIARSSIAPSVLGDAAMLGRARRIGLFAGSFNPQTVAHAAVTQAVHAAAALDLVLWAMARITVDKERVTRATLTDRAVQLLAYGRAAAPDDMVIVLDVGLYADQAAALRRLIAPDAELWLIVGFDKLVQILDPRYYPDREAALRPLLAAAGLLVVPRAGQGEPEMGALLGQPENRQYASGVRFLPVSDTLAHIASTEARRLLAGAAADLAAGTGTALARLLTPEGAALGLATGAYQLTPESGPGAAPEDRYAARMQWLDAPDNEP